MCLFSYLQAQLAASTEVGNHPDPFKLLLTNILFLLKLKENFLELVRHVPCTEREQSLFHKDDGQG